VPIIRQHRRNRYTVIPNATAEDERLTFKARGVLAYLLAKPDGWTPRMTAIESASPGEGRAAVRSAVTELIDAGYITRERVNLGGGRFDWTWHVYDVPPVTGSGQRSDQAEQVLPLVAPLTDNHAMVNGRSSKSPDSKEPLEPLRDVKAVARTVAGSWYDTIKARTGHRPLQGFMAAAGVVEKALQAGYSPEQVAGAVRTLETVTTFSLQSALQAQNARAVNAPDEAYTGSTL
jgi:hypothetical protein